MKRITIFMLVVLFASSVLIAQIKQINANRRIAVVESSIQDSIQSMLDDYDKIVLPPLSVFLASAEEHPSLRIFKSRVEFQEAEKQIVNRDWLRYISAFASYQYGYNNAMYNYYNADDPVAFDKNASAQHRYAVGVSVTIPMSDLFSQKYKRKKQQANLDEIRYDDQISFEERKLVILQAYNNVVDTLATITVKAEAAAFYNAQMIIVEVDSQH